MIRKYDRKASSAPHSGTLQVKDRGRVFRIRNTAVTALTLLSFAACTELTSEPRRTEAEQPAFTITAADEESRYIVVLKEPSNLSVVRSLAREYADSVFHEYTHAFVGFAGRISPQRVAALRNNPKVKYVEQDQKLYNEGIDYNAGWGLGRIDQRYGPSDNVYEYDYDGTGVNIYIVDSGITASHPDFGGRVQSAWSTNPVTFPANFDCVGHGTAVASIAGGSEYGVAKNATLWSVRAHGCQNWQWVSIWTQAIDWVVANHQKPAVMNFSVGTHNWVDDILPGSMNDAVKRARAAGVFVAVSAGNNGTLACNHAPANASEVITVGAVNRSGYRASFSNYGSCVDIFAPGDTINVATGFSGYATASGTSFAAPFVSGTAALWFDREPTASVTRAEAALLQSSSKGVVINAGSGSPNLLVFSKLSSPVSGSISGPDFAFAPGTHTFTGSATGGEGPYEYWWEAIFVDNDPNTTVGLDSGPVLEMNITGCDRNIELMLWARSGNAEAIVASHFVNNMISYDPGACGG